MDVFRQHALAIFQEVLDCSMHTVVRSGNWCNGFHAHPLRRKVFIKHTKQVCVIFFFKLPSVSEIPLMPTEGSPSHWMSQLLLITDFDLPPDQILSDQRPFTSFLVVFFVSFCFLFLCLLLLLVVIIDGKNFDIYNHESWFHLKTERLPLHLAHVLQLWRLTRN